MNLFDAQRHEPLTDTVWDEVRARSAIAEILDDAHAGFTAEGLWPIHPLDRSDERPPDCLKPLYHGAAGVIWALHHLRSLGFTAYDRDYRPIVRDLIRQTRGDLDRYPGVAAYMGGQEAAFLVGETGILLLQARLEPSATVADQLHASIAASVGDTRGPVWGGAGAMLATVFMHERTGDPRWRALFGDHFDALWRAWRHDDEARCWLWTQDLYGVAEQRLGALHGFMANAAAMLRGRALLPPDRRDEALRRIVETAHATALVEDGRANWPNSFGATPARLMVQHCSGGPGFITVLAELPGDPALDALLLQAGELVWDAGPPVKLPSLCHGAPGSGYAFLKLHARTGDALWLHRARRFAMHAIEQADSALAHHGQRKFSLWTGDLGLAIYLSDCIGGAARFPTVDVF